MEALGCRESDRAGRCGHPRYRRSRALHETRAMLLSCRIAYDTPRDGADHWGIGYGLAG